MGYSTSRCPSFSRTWSIFSHHPPTQANTIISLHMMKLKNNVSVRDFEHFYNEIDLAGLKSFECLEVDNVKPQKIVSSSPLVTV